MSQEWHDAGGKLFADDDLNNNVNFTARLKHLESEAEQARNKMISDKFEGLYSDHATLGQGIAIVRSKIYKLVCFSYEYESSKMAREVINFNRTYFDKSFYIFNKVDDFSYTGQDLLTRRMVDIFKHYNGKKLKLNVTAILPGTECELSETLSSINLAINLLQDFVDEFEKAHHGQFNKQFCPLLSDNGDTLIKLVEEYYSLKSFYLHIEKVGCNDSINNWDIAYKEFFYSGPTHQGVQLELLNIHTNTISRVVLGGALTDGLIDANRNNDCCAWTESLGSGDYKVLRYRELISEEDLNK